MCQSLSTIALLCFVLVVQGQPSSYTSTHTSGSGSSSTSANAVASTDDGTSKKSTSTTVSSYITDETFGCTKDLKTYLTDAKLPFFKTFPCDEAKSIPNDGYSCQVHHSQKYKVYGHDQLAECYTPSAKICCNLCRAMSACYSWWRKYSNGKCYLNRIHTGGWHSSSSAGGNI